MEARVNIVTGGIGSPYISSVDDPHNIFNVPPDILRVKEETLSGKPVNEYFKLRLTCQLERTQNEQRTT